MQEIKVNRGFYTNTLTEVEVNDILTENAFLKSILLMVLNKTETWENEHESEFTRDEAVDYLKTANIFKGFDKSFIENSINKIKLI